MKKLVSCMAVILCLVLVMPLAGGCSEPDEENTFIKLLGLLPAEAKEGRVITIIDYESFRKVNSISLSDEDGKRITEEEYLDDIRNVYETGASFGYDILDFGSDWTGILGVLGLHRIVPENIGYSITDVNAEINNIYDIGTTSGIGQYGHKTEPLIGALGDFDAKSTGDAMENHGEWPSWAVDNFRSEEYKEIVIYSWVNGMKGHLDCSAEPPHFDVFGRALPLAVTDGQLFLAVLPKK